MNIKNKSIFIGLLGLGLVVGSVQAEVPRDKAYGYVTDTSGNILRNSSGGCVHNSNWTKKHAVIEGCDGAVLDAPIEVVVGQGSGNIAAISIPAASMFAFDKSELTGEGKSAIEAYRKTLRPELSESYAVVVVGHADSTGNEKYNQELSFARAASVAEYLISTGLQSDILRVIGRGSSQPLASNDTSEGRAMNRRVEIFGIAELRALDAFRFPSVALFERRSGTLSSKGAAVLEKNRMDARELLSRANFVEIVGHTDDVGDDAYNQDLSEQRAKAVRDYLVSKGLDPSIVFTTGMGESMPIASNNTPEGRAENRRVEVLLLGRIKE